MGCKKLHTNYYTELKVIGSKKTLTLKSCIKNVRNQTEYLPFGETLVEEHLNSNNSPYKFNAKEMDAETGWYYYSARYYDPKFSIWLSVDPLMELYPDWSPYNYVLHNPVNLVDPTGLTPTEYENRSTCETVTVHDGSDATVQVSDSDFQKAKFFANEINPTVEADADRMMSIGVDKEIADAYKDFYKSSRSYENASIGNIFNYVFDTPEIITNNTVLDGSGGMELIGGPAKQGVTQLAKTLGLVKIQKHHIIPKAVYNKAEDILKPLMGLNSGTNLKKIPTPFHGNHPQYNEYVSRRIQSLIDTQSLTPQSLRSLQQNLNSQINKAYDSGLKLNDYFRKLNK